MKLGLASAQLKNGRVRGGDMLAVSAVLLPLLLLVLTPTTGAIKLKLRFEESMYKEVSEYQPFHGSLLVLPNPQGEVPSFDLIITAPSGTKVHEALDVEENSFHVVPYETGKFRFHIRVNHAHPSARYHSRNAAPHEVLWDLHTTETQHHKANLQEEDTEDLYNHIKLVDNQVQQLRSTQQYLYWRERRHRLTVESTQKRVLWYALLRSGALVLAGAVQVVVVCRMFSK